MSQKSRLRAASPRCCPPNRGVLGCRERRERGPGTNRRPRGFEFARPTSAATPPPSFTHVTTARSNLQPGRRSLQAFCARGTAPAGGGYVVEAERGSKSRQRRGWLGPSYARTNIWHRLVIGRTDS